MTKRTAGTLSCLIFSGLALAQTPGTGRIDIKTTESYSGSKPLPKPGSIVVYNVAVNAG